MTKFFMPGKSSEEAEKLHQSFRESVASTASKKIYSITFRERVKGKWKEVKATVGTTNVLGAASFAAYQLSTNQLVLIGITSSDTGAVLMVF